MWRNRTEPVAYWANLREWLFNVPTWRSWAIASAMGEPSVNPYASSIRPTRPHWACDWAVWFLACACAGCEATPATEGPEEVVREFLTRMEQVHGDPADARSAYELMWSEARKNLGERAKRASAAAGRQVAPEEMIAPSRFSLTFLPQTYKVVVQGQWADVTVAAEQPARYEEKVRCRLEDGEWRVVVRLPPVSPIQRRVEADQRYP
jgi:hypothetical protein